LATLVAYASPNCSRIRVQNSLSRTVLPDGYPGTTGHREHRSVLPARLPAPGGNPNRSPIRSPPAPGQPAGPAPSPLRQATRIRYKS
jgi:hypothetical protein